MGRTGGIDWLLLAGLVAAVAVALAILLGPVLVGVLVETVRPA